MGQGLAGARAACESDRLCNFPLRRSSKYIFRVAPMSEPYQVGRLSSSLRFPDEGTMESNTKKWEGGKGK